MFPRLKPAAPAFSGAQANLARAGGGEGSPGGNGGGVGAAAGAPNEAGATGATATGLGGDGGSTGESGVPGGCQLAAGRPTLASTGQSGHLLLRGTFVMPHQIIEGEVLVDGDTISCVAASCSAAPTYAQATVVETRGIIFPGLIDTHNHVLFDTFDDTDWAPTKAYANHNQWTNEARYSAMLDAKRYLNGEGSSPVDYGCELDKYGELKALVAGTTSIVGAANPPNRTCFGTLARTIDQTTNGLGADKVQVATLFPNTSAADGVCTNFADGDTTAYRIHVAEGTDQTAKNEFATLNTVTTTDGCLYAPQTAIVHGTALDDADFSVMAAHQMSLVWSPRSNVFLYGGGTDLTKTTNVPLALSKGINVALAPDWSIGGSQNLLDELRFADQVDNTVWGDVLTPKMLVEMVTTHAARVLGLQAVLGSIEVGKKADLMVMGGDRCTPYDALIASSPSDVRLVMVGGTVLYGDAPLQPLGPAIPGCEAMNVCGTDKFVCVAAASHTATDKFGQTLAHIQTTLSAALSDYDALNLSAWDFSPLTPIVRCR
jgi:5-methylthioadenosine/S-adenosylhomocysteine deaminase